MIDASDSQLDALLARAGRDITPAQDLWPDIAAQTSSPRYRRRPPWGLAAGIAALTLVASFALRVWDRSAAPVPYLARSGPAHPALPVAAPPDASYLRARAQLEQSYRAQLDQLAPGTRVQVEHDLDVIRNARADIRRALAADPGSLLLNELMATTWQREIDLYRDVAANTTVATRRDL